MKKEDLKVGDVVHVNCMQHGESDVTIKELLHHEIESHGECSPLYSQIEYIVTPKVKTLETLEVGDEVTCEEITMTVRVVLAPGIYVMSHSNEKKGAHLFDSIDLENFWYKVVQPSETTEMTVKEIEEKLGVTNLKVVE